MILTLKRVAKESKYTIGKLYNQSNLLMDTLEDTDRGLTQTDSLKTISDKKIYGETAIPKGKYKIDMNTVSPKFKDRVWVKPYDGKLPRLINVPGYEGILIHVGNKPEDTLGCILVGKNTSKGLLTESTVSFNILMKLLLEADKRNEEIWIEII